MPEHASLTASWFAARWGLDPVALEVRRRAGEVFATREPGSDEWRYPSWQFDEEGHVRPEVVRVLGAAREAGVSPAQLDELFNRRVGLAGRRTMLDSLLAGEDGPVLEAIRRLR
jgi:hypothetical protein